MPMPTHAPTINRARRSFLGLFRGGTDPSAATVSALADETEVSAINVSSDNCVNPILIIRHHHESRIKKKRCVAGTHVTSRVVFVFLRARPRFPTA